MDTLGQSSLLVSLASFAFGVSVLSRNVRNKLFLSFAGLMLLISVWSLAFFLEKILPDRGFYRLHLFFNVLLAPVSLVLIQVMVRVQDGLSKRMLIFSSSMAFLLSMALVLHLERHFWILQLIYFSPILIVFQILQLMRMDQRLTHSGMKQFSKAPAVGLGRRNFIYMGGLVILMTSVMDHVPWVGIALPSFGNLALIAYVFFLSQVITQQRLLNINALTSRLLVLLVVALTLTGVYSLLFAWIANSPALFFLNSFIASFLLLILLDPLRAMVGYFTQILLTKKHRKLQATLNEAQRNLTGIVDLGTLFQATLMTLEQVLHPEWAAIFVLRSGGTKYRRLRSTGHTSTFKELLVNHPIIEYVQELMRKGMLPLVLDQILENEIDRSASRTQREYFSRLIQGLKALESNLLIPLIDSGKILGFIAVWVPSPPEPWGNNWGLLPIIYPYFQQVAHTMQNMEVYTRQREKERLAALGEMSAGLAHEIRNPLGAIKGAAQFLDPSADRPESKFLRVIIEEVDRLNRVVSQFLDYSKPPTLDFKPMNLSQVAERTVECMKPGIRSGIELEFQGLKVPASVLGSAEQISQVLINLIQNSQRALEGELKGNIRVRVGFGEGFPHSEVILAVEDTGHGIKKENLEKIFIPFFTTSPSGTGLGLSISQKIVEAHRGRIEVNSEGDHFTRVSVILPLFENSKE